MQTEQSEAEVIAMPGLRSRMAAYQNNTNKKKTSGADADTKKKKVGKLQPKLRDPGQFESATSGAQKQLHSKPVFQVDEEVPIEDALQLDPNHGAIADPSKEEEPLPIPKSPRKKKNSMHPFMTQNGSPQSPHKLKQSPLPSPTMSDNSSHSQHQPTEVEVQAKSKLNTLLQHEMGDNKVANNYDVCRVRYLRAVGKLRPVDYYEEGNDSFQDVVQNSLPDIRARRREKRRTEKEKKGRYDRLKASWHTYEDVATDKPIELTPEDEELEKDLDEIEEEIHEEWEDFTEDVIRIAEEEKEAGVAEAEDSDIEAWRDESRKLKLDAEIRKKRKLERIKKRHEILEEKKLAKEEEAARLENEKKQKEEREAGDASEKEKLQKIRHEKERSEREEKERLEKERIEMARNEKEASGTKDDEEKQEKAAAATTSTPVADQPENKKNPYAKKPTNKQKSKRSLNIRLENYDADADADADNEKDEGEVSPAKRNGKNGKHEKKKPSNTSSAPSENADDTDNTEEERKNKRSSHGVSKQLSPNSRRDTDRSDTETDASHSGVSDMNDSSAVNTDIALSPKKGRKKLNGRHGDPRNPGTPLKNLKYFAKDDDEDEEEDILAGMAKDRKQIKEKEKQDQPPAEVVGENNSPKRKKKELRVEYDNGIPKEITIIAEIRPDKKGDADDDESLSEISSSGTESSGSESESSSSEESPAKKGKIKGIMAKKKNDKHGILRIDTLPNQQFYDGTEESPFLAWTHRPLKCKVDGSQIVVKVPPRTDCWRKTRHNFIMDNAPFYWHRVSGNFEVMVKVTGDMKKMYDKAGIMIRLDAENWIVTGLEYFNNELNHMTCVTRDYTDWSMAPISSDAKSQGAWICVKRIGNAYETFCSMDGRNWRQARQGLFTDAASVRVGIFCACPMGESYKVTFDKYRCKNLSI